MPVGVVLTKQGHDIGPAINQLADREQMDAQGFLGLLIAESNLDEQARRPVDPAQDLAYWPDVSGSLGQQTVRYAVSFGLGDGSSTRANIDAVMARLMTDLAFTLDIAAQQWGAFYRASGDWRTACAKYNGGGGATWQTIPAANRANYERGYAATAAYMGETPMPAPTCTYNPDTPPVLQTDSWSCSIASATWARRACGQAAGYPAMERAALDQRVVTTDSGLQDARGYGLAAFLQGFGLPAEAHEVVDWNWVQAHAGRGALLLGGHHWGSAGHWVGCRAVLDADSIALANPAPGYPRPTGPWQTLASWQFQAYGDFAAVWIPVEMEDPEMIAELQNTIGYLEGDVADAFEGAIVAIEQAKTLKAAKDAAAQGLRPALATLRRGGPPEENSDGNG